MELREVALGTMLGDTRNILVRTPEEADQTPICTRLFEGRDPVQAVVVSYEQSVEDWLTDTQRSDLAAVAFVSVGETVRSTAATTPTDTMGPVGPGERVRIDGVGDPTDLSALGLTINAHLTAFEESGHEVVVCFDALSALVAAVGLRRAFRFLHVLTSRITASGVTAHYHYDHELTTQELDTLRPLFDAELTPHESQDSGRWALTAISHGDGV